MYQKFFTSDQRSSYLNGIQAQPPRTVYMLENLDLRLLGISGGAADLKVGATVVLDGLASRPELNGRQATCKEYVPETGRWRVEADSEVVGLRPQNMRLHVAEVATTPLTLNMMPHVSETLFSRFVGSCVWLCATFWGHW